MKKKVIVFGTGTGAKKVKGILESMQYKILFYVDNNSNKWGTIIDGLVVRSPEDILETKCEYDIVIASVYFKEIETQLIDMGVHQKKIWSRESLILKYIDENINALAKELDVSESLELQDDLVVFDLGEGLNLGGVETWSETLAQRFVTKGKKILLFTKDNNEKSERLERYVKRFKLEYENYIPSIIAIARELIHVKPKVVVTNWLSQIFFATYLVNKLSEQKIRIISMLHNNLTATFQKNAFLSRYIDAHMCVSKDIMERCKNEFDIPVEKLYYKESPIVYEDSFEKRYVTRENVVQIAFAARITKKLKRADLVVPLAEKLLAKKVSFCINVAGNGEYFESLKEEIRKKGLQNHVKLLGMIPHTEMNKYWKQNDIYLNLSETEGASIAMLEAMSYGLIPVVTDVSGVNEYVVHGKNGFISKVNDIANIAGNIEYLISNKHLFSEMGEYSRREVKEKCSVEDYVNYFFEMIRKIGEMEKI